MGTIKVGQTYFATRAYPYSCSFDEIIQKLTILCDESEEEEIRSKYILDVCDNFWFHNELSFSKRVCHYQKGSKSKCKNYDFYVFYINRSVIKKCFKSLLFHNKQHFIDKDNELKTTLKSMKKIIEREIKYIEDDKEKKYWIGVLEDLGSFFKLLAGENVIDDHVFESIKVLNKKWKTDFQYHQGIIYHKISVDFSKIDTLIHNVQGYEDVENLFHNADIKCVAVVSKLGIINFSFILDFDIKCGPLVTPKINNAEMAKSVAIDFAKTVFGRTNDIPKLFSYIDFNYMLGFSKMIIIDNLVENSDGFIKGQYDDNEYANLNIVKIEAENRNYCRRFLDRFSCNKCVHLHFIADDDCNNEHTMFFFDYLSLLSAYNYSYDPFYLWNVIVKDKEKLEPNDKIIDYISKPTEHMFIDNMCVVISQINPVVQNAMIKIGEDNTLDNISHQTRIYTHWNYSYACNASCFGSFASISYHLLDTVSNLYFVNSYLKLKRVYKLHKFSYISSIIESQFSVRYFSTKFINLEIVKPIFSNMGLYELSEARESRSKELWQNTNLSSTQLYNRYGITLSAISLLISIVSFGLVSAVFISRQKVNSSFDFYGIALSSAKFWFIISIAAIPVLLWLVFNIIGFAKNRRMSLIKESKIFENITNKKIIEFRHKKQ